MHNGRPPSCVIHFHSLIPTKKRKPGVCIELFILQIGISQLFFSEWHFHLGSFCLVRNPGLDGIPPEECTRDRYWKARIVEIQRPKRKSKDTCNPVSCEISQNHLLPHIMTFQEHYLLVTWFYSPEDIKEVMPNSIEALDR